MTERGAEALAGLMTTAAERLSGIDLGPAHGSTEPAEAAPEGPALARGRAAAEPSGEPVFDDATTADIQGNVFPGFNKDHQRFLFLSATDVEGARRWLGWLAPRLSSMREVLDFRREFRRERLLTGQLQPSRSATWTAFALSGPGIVKLLGRPALDEMGDQAFRQGLAERSTYLGDPSQPGTPGHRDGWRVGGPGREADFLVTVAADSADDLETASAEILAEAARHGIEVTFDQVGANLPGALAGHEHFGFKDGVSQPGVRGATADGELLSPRYLAPSSPHARLFGKAGQPVVWPGQFLLGQPRQDPADPLVAGKGPAEGTNPRWTRNGSYLVCRRLDQDVPAFWEFAATAAEAFGTTPVHLASLLVGRWPSGAPVSRSAQQDDPALAGDEFAHNHFLFEDDTRDWTPTRALREAGYAGDTHPRARADIAGRACPLAAHVRKVNPRDSGTDFGAPADTLLRLMLRRGIPYGPVLAGVADPSPELVEAERGLMFVAHMSSIEDQFEFVVRRWSNSPLQPNTTGHDPVIGQSDVRGDRTRTLDLESPSGARHSFTLDREWVTVTGGGYFFAPAISAVAGRLAAAADD